jgi:integrase
MALIRRGQHWWLIVTVSGKRALIPTGETSKPLAIIFERRERERRALLTSPEKQSRTAARPKVAKKMRFGEVLDRYLDTVMLTKRRDKRGGLRKTVSNEIYRLHRLETQFGRSTSVAHVAKWSSIAEFNHLLLRSLQPDSASRYLSLLRAVLNKAYEWGTLDHPPYVRLNPGQPMSNRYLTDDEERRLLAACPDRIRDFVTFILDTGARKNEALNLTWRHVDLKRKPRATVTFIQTKNGDARTVPLPRRGKATLIRLHRKITSPDSAVFEHPASMKITTRNGDLFARKGDPIPLSNYQLLWRKARRSIGLGDIKLHDLRHSYASKLVRHGVPLLDVAKLLGHRSISMTMRYSHLAIGHLDFAVAALEKEAD